MSEPPAHYQLLKQQQPHVIQAYESLDAATRGAGPLDGKTVSLVKLALGLGAGLEGATHSAARRALEAGCRPDELRHVVLLATTTLGFPAMMRGRAWVEDVLDPAK